MSAFTFKQFTIKQNHAAMKVSTDGILLGAWAPVEGVKHILDIGTGTGLIALMSKQRNPQASVTAVEIDEQAVLDAKDNFMSSPWPDIQLQQIDIQSFYSDNLFDLIISNPPYFNDSLKGPNERRNRARHTDSLSFLTLITSYQRLSTPTGKLAVILPESESQHFCQLVNQRQLFIQSNWAIRSAPDKAVSRRLLLIGKVPKNLLQQVLVIRNEKNQYSEAFTNLCKAFYLKM
ncbi:tRNA1(Val) (adenine(37)-N6)-methyltransferase [Pseudoalteromonas sp. T1lg65]|uniref:tRNA1(Val) (adenine(37)-N6)-methyltransferase n=1 Tax=Pseudoalteromonas sp. T1lg65 TaxID=2077101 RepID=UPI003F7A667B